MIRNLSSTPLEGTLETSIIDQNGKSVLIQKAKFNIAGETTTLVRQAFSLDNPVLWTLENPALYKAVNKVFAGKTQVDEYETPFGIRFFVFDRDNGFFLNGKKTKILGVCNHHDLGCLGAAVNTRAIERQLEILKAMGCNAIRTSHNPPAPELLDLCDKMGFVVMDEAFDMWKKKKTANDYSYDWDEWHKRDLQDLIRRDRNHPSVIIWSIGNEILEQWDSTGTTIARELAEIVKEVDTTRPITSACNETKPINSIIKSGVLDLIGYNYKQDEYPEFKNTYATGAFIGSETTSALPKDAYYMYQSEWTQAPVMHLFPHWNWIEGDSVDMWVYTNSPEVELFLNGKSLGTKKKGLEDIHLQWRVKYEPGEVKAVGLLSSGENITDIIKTAGKPARIELVPDRTTLSADGKDLSFITVRILDEEGNLVPDSENRVKFTIKGDGTLAGVDNGDPVSHESFRADSRKAFHGLCLVVVRTGMTKGNIELVAESEGLSPAKVSLTSK